MPEQDGSSPQSFKMSALNCDLDIGIYRHKAFGRGDGNFWLDDVNCGGREYDIERCSHRDWGRHNCRSMNQAGVICKLHRSDVIFAPEPSPASGEVCMY